MGLESSFPFFTICYSEKVVGGTNIQLSIIFCLLEAHQRFLQEREKISILDYTGIKGSVIHVELKRAIALLNKQDWHTSQGKRSLDKFLRGVVVQLSF